MMLQTDQGSELSVALHGIDDPARTPLIWLQHPRCGPATKTLTVEGGKFVLSP